MGFLDSQKEREVRDFFTSSELSVALANPMQFELIRDHQNNPLVALGRTETGNATVLIPIRTDHASSKLKRSSLTNAISVKQATYRFDEIETEQFIQMQCVMTDLNDVFGSLVVDLIDELATTSDNPLLATDHVITKWRELLRPERIRNARAEVIGLFGELFLLEQLSRFNSDLSIESWRGPDGGIHDFTTRLTDIEVKTTTQNEPYLLSVDNKNQIVEIAESDLYLYRVAVKEHPAGRNLRSLASDIIALNVPAGELLEKFDKVIPREILPTVDRATYEVVSASFYHVDNRFPRLFPDGQFHLPRGIRALKYTIDLSEATLLTTQNAQDLLRKFVGGE